MKQLLMKTSRHLLYWVAAAAVAAALPLLAEPPPAVAGFAPAFAGYDQDGRAWKLSHHLRKRLVLLYFYPTDDTAESATEAANMRDNMPFFKQEGVDVVGVSFDGRMSHKKFIFKYNLDFPLLTDHSGLISDAYGARVGEDKKMDRFVSFLIGLDGKIIHVTDSKDPAFHLKDMASAILKLKGKISL
jgi:thioredoxin-dependent peroxiredoxin